ncbi:hypothetical protein [Sporosarcina koreensis]|uniref:Lipoprotein n=1 Tax=Sporosarcina koreensis TaxID=334735 RepID=A0ABW0TWS6_9BACL
MKKSFLLPLLLLIMTGCSFNNDGYTFTEISSLDNLDDNAQEFFIRNVEDKSGIGIFVNKVNDENFYLYLSPEFIANNGRNFIVDVKTEKDSFNLYITDTFRKEDIREYRLYEVFVEKEYEYLRTFKNGKEIDMQVIGENPQR